MAVQNLMEHGGAAEHEAKWQRHVVVTLWVLLALCLVVSLGLMYAKTHGWFQGFSPDFSAPWPAEWP